MGQSPVGEQQTMDQTADRYTRATVGDNTGQNTHKGHTRSPRIEIKIPDSAGNGTRAAGRKAATATLRLYGRRT